jgi:hypothetical protein
MTSNSPITAILWMRFRIWVANRLLDLGLIDAAKWVAPEDTREGQRFYRF